MRRWHKEVLLLGYYPGHFWFLFFGYGLYFRREVGWYVKVPKRWYVPVVINRVPPQPNLGCGWSCRIYLNAEQTKALREKLC